MYIYNFNDNMNGIPMVNVEMAPTTTSQGANAAPPPPPPTTATSASNLSVGTISNAAGATPLTPEILNSVMAMTNPLEYSFPANVSGAGSMTTTKMSQVRMSSSFGAAKQKKIVVKIRSKLHKRCKEKTKRDPR